MLEQWHVQIHDSPTPPGRHGGVGALIGSPMAACNIGQVQYMYLSREVIQRFVVVSCLRNQLSAGALSLGLPSQDTLVRALLLSIGGPLPINLSPQQATVVRGILPDSGQSLSR